MRGALALGVAVAGLVGALVLHEHHFSAIVTAYILDGVPHSLRMATLPSWRDPLALICVFGAFSLAVHIARGPRRVGLALGVVGCAIGGAIYLHQQAVHHCPPVSLGCPLFRPDSGLWTHPSSVLAMAAGVVVAGALVLPHRWLAVSRLRLHHH